MFSGIYLSLTSNSAFHSVDFILSQILPTGPPAAPPLYLPIFTDPTEKYVPSLLFQQKVSGLNFIHVSTSDPTVTNPTLSQKVGKAES